MADSDAQLYERAASGDESSLDTLLARYLPQLHAYDLTYRHALDIDGSGDCLAFGTTTGSLYVSNDGGDLWQCVSEHLPPIDCVRFA